MIGLLRPTWEVTMLELKAVWRQGSVAFRSVLPRDIVGDIE